MNAPWFDPNLYSFLPGTLLGIAGGVIGTLTGVLAPSGRARSLVLGAYVVAIAISCALLVAGIVALVVGQPYGVWYGLGLPGLIGAVVFGALWPVVRQRYTEAESRRLAAADLR